MLQRVVASPRVQRLFGRLIRIGRDPAMAPSDARYVVLSNIIAMLGVVFTLGFAPVLLLSGSLVYPALQVSYALGYLPTLWLNHRGHHVAATTWLLLGGHLLVVSQVLVEGTGFDVHLFFMSPAPITPKRWPRWAWRCWASSPSSRRAPVSPSMSGSGSTAARWSPA